MISSTTKESLPSFRDFFLSRLDTLSHILETGVQYFKFETDSILDYKMIDDMLPLGTQIAFTCNQPRNFTLWCEGKRTENLPTDVNSLEHAKQIIFETKKRLEDMSIKNANPSDTLRIDIANGQYLELTNNEFILDFLIPNFHFHLVTTYNIMRMKGAPLGKFNYMHHLVSKVRS